MASDDPVKVDMSKDCQQNPEDAVNDGQQALEQGQLIVSKDREEVQDVQLSLKACTNKAETSSKMKVHKCKECHKVFDR